MLLFTGHRVDYDGALQSDLKLHGRARRQVFLPKLLAVDDDAGPGLGVVGLIADDEMDRLALLAELDGRVSRVRRQQAYARQRQANTDSLAEVRHLFLPGPRSPGCPGLINVSKTATSPEASASGPDQRNGAAGKSPRPRLLPATTPQRVEGTPENAASARESRDGREKDFVSPIRTTPWGSIKSPSDYLAPSPDALKSQELAHEPEALKIDALPAPIPILPWIH